MSSELSTIEVDGCTVAYSDTGEGSVVVLLHGGAPGPRPYAASRHVWTPLSELLATHHRVLAIDRPGFGDSPAGDLEDLTYAAAERAVVRVLQELDVSECHVVGHGEGGLLALQIARSMDVSVLSCTVLAGNEAAPTGDSPHPLRLSSPPVPTISRRAQAWVVERLSYTPHHIDDDFLDSLAAHASSASAEHVAGLAERGERRLRSDLLATKDRLFGYARDVGYAVPITLVWASDDPLSPIERGVALMDLLATTSAPLDLQVVNRAGHFVFRERPHDVAELLLRGFSREALAV